ncbi:LysM peptidoglycan-binding domain-containing protein [Roseivirga sp.]|uniref:LysM peptidoglycan-binding domain-containing protein n=1 Tax=Roseivirga sp. TaxID=1964215 RepID=UPI003BAB1E2B
MMASLNLSAQAPINVPSVVEVAGVKLKLNAEAKRDVEETLDLLVRSQYHFQLKADRSNLYMHFVEEILKKEGIPEDFKYLAIQEGEFISDAVSTSNAVGFWQFKKASAQELGVRVDNVVDERKHIIASTIGATKYFKRSNFVFDNWVLSMQSYLQGLTGTQRTASDKLYGAKTMNITGKSHWYIKKFIAHKLAFQDFVGNGRKNPEIQLADYEGKGKTLRQVSKEVKVDYDELKRFNKWLNQSKIPDDKSYKVIYPLKGNKRPVAQSVTKPKTNTVKKNPKTQTNSNPPKRRNPTVRVTSGIKPLEGNVGIYPQVTGNIDAAYQPRQIKMNKIWAIKARPNETLQSLSARTGISTAKLRRYNDLGQRRIQGNQYYYLKNKKTKGRVHYHVVLQGETLWSIAQDYGVRLKKLQQKNRIKSGEVLKVGRVLWLRFIRPEKTPIEYSNVKVERKEEPAEDRLINEVTLATTLLSKEKRPKVEIPVKKDPEEEKVEIFNKPKPRRALVNSATDTIITHLVKKQETFFALSTQYNVEIDDILFWNNLKLEDGLGVGQVIKLMVPKAKKEERKIEEVLHVVKPGETLWSISKLYDVSLEDLRGWNNKTNNDLSPGEKLKILKQ